MKTYLNLSEEQEKFLKENPDFNMQEWFELVLNDKISRIKAKGQKINAIIAAAGYDTRISDINKNTPKAMLKIKGKSLIERQIETLKTFNIDDITVIRGYKKEEFNLPGIQYIDNNEYDTTGILHSFFLASEKIIGKTVLLYADILFDKDIVGKLINSNADYAVVVDRSWRDNYHDRVQHTISEAELVEVKDGLISRMGLNIPFDSAYGEFVGLAAFSAHGAIKAKKLYEELKGISDDETSGPAGLSKVSLVDFFNALIKQGEKITPVDVLGGWFEIDTFEDYRKSWTMVK